MSEPFDLESRVALVTGAASGIGRACAARYAAEGATVLTTDVDDAGGQRTVDETGATEYRHLDVADPGAWADLVAHIRTEHGRLDLVHLNAGIRLGEGDITALSDDDYLRVIGVNQHGVFHGLRATVPILEGDGGDVLVTASRASLAPLPNDLAYAMSKHAVAGLVRSVADDLASRGIRINAICPATVDTGFLAGAGRDRLEAAGIAVMDADEVADGALHVLGSGETGRCFVQLPGASPEVFAFTEVPGR